jgi:dCMP deaminase
MVWHNRFLELAKFISTWSKDSTKVGAVIVDPKTKQVVGIGYNGFPRGVEDSEDRYANRETKLKLIVHAEVNAILNANKSVQGCDLYVYPTMMIPDVCPDCAKVVAQSGIKRVFYYKGKTAERWQELAKYSKLIFDESNIECTEIE